LQAKGREQSRPFFVLAVAAVNRDMEFEPASRNIGGEPFNLMSTEFITA